MKKILLVLAGCLIASGVDAQFTNVSGGGAVLNLGRAARNLKKNLTAKTLNKLDYRVDTFHYKGELILKQRYGDHDITTVYGDNSSENKAATALMDLQKQLDDMNRFVVLNSDINFIAVGQNLINQIKNSGADFDCSNYQKELDFYDRANRALADARAEKARAEQLEKERYVIEATAKEKERTRIQDSVNEANEQEKIRTEALNRIALAKEAKALEKELTKKYGSVNAKAMMNGQVLLGMTREMCVIAWGEPETTNKSVTKGLVTEKWYYSYSQFVVFKNGKVTMINE